MQVYFFTRTNRSEKIAQDIAKANNVTANKITDGIDWSGPIKFLKGGAMSSSKKDVKANYEKVNDNETIVLVFPVWAGSFPPAIRTFVNENSRGNIIAVPTSLGTKLKDRDGFKKIIDLVGKEIETPDISE